MKNIYNLISGFFLGITIVFFIILAFLPMIKMNVGTTVSLSLSIIDLFSASSSSLSGDVTTNSNPLIGILAVSLILCSNIFVCVGKTKTIRLFSFAFLLATTIYVNTTLANVNSSIDAVSMTEGISISGLKALNVYCFLTSILSLIFVFKDETLVVLSKIGNKKTLSLKEQLEELNELKQSNLITEEEYQRKRKELL